jgi:hypothetical protein
VVLGGWTPGVIVVGSLIALAAAGLVTARRSRDDAPEVAEELETTP